MDVKTLCLGALSRGPASGYEIKKQFQEGPFAHFHDAGFGSIYPALNKLNQAGLVSCTAMEQDKRPDKKVYSLTPSGRLALVNAISQAPGADSVRSDFLFMLFFAHLLSARQVEGLLSDRVEWYRTTVARMKETACASAPERPGERFVHGLGIALYEAMADYIDDHRHELVGEILLMDQKAVAS